MPQRLEAGDDGVDGAPGRAFSVPHERDVRDQVEAEERGREQTRDGGCLRPRPRAQSAIAHRTGRVPWNVMA